MIDKNICCSHARFFNIKSKWDCQFSYAVYIFIHTLSHFLKEVWQASKHESFDHFRQLYRASNKCGRLVHLSYSTLERETNLNDVFWQINNREKHNFAVKHYEVQQRISGIGKIIFFCCWNFLLMIFEGIYGLPKLK